MESIKEFQSMSRIEQIRSLVSERIASEGYSLEDFQKDYYTSEADREEFLRVQAEIVGK